MLNRSELTEAFRQAALAVSTAEGEHVFEQLVTSLARILGVEFALISVYVEPRRTHLRTLATYFDGRLAKNMEYPVAGTPCEQAIGRSFGFYPKGVAGRFPTDGVLSMNGIEAYAATTLHDVDGAPIGALTIMSRREIKDAALTEAMLNIFAARVSAEIGRQYSEASYRAVFENAETAIFLHDIDSDAIVDVNPRACAVYGYSAEELKRLSLDELSSGVPPYTGGEARRHFERAKAGEVVRGEWQRRNKDGTLHWDEVTLKKVQIAGRPHIMAATREITERKLAEEALRASEEQYRAIFNATTDSLTLRDAEFRIVDVNATYERMSGLKREDVIGMTELTVDVLDVQDWRRDVHERVLKGEAMRIESDARRRDGTLFRVEVLVLPMQYRGAPHALLVARDITTRKRADEAVRASEEQYRAIFNATDDALVLRDAQFRIVDVNAAYEAMSGKRRADVAGMTELTLTRDASAIDRRALHAEALAGKTVHFEADGRRPDGAPFVLEVRGIPMTYRGEPHVLYIGRDVTEAKHAERELRESEEQYRAIFNASFDGMIIRTLEGEIVDVNPALLKMYGYRREDLLGKDFGPIISGSRIEGFREYLAEIAAGRPYRTESRVPRKDGSAVYIEVLGSPVTYRGKPHALSVVRDITERRAREARMRATVAGALDCIIVMDSEGVIREFNPAAEACFGFARDDVLGRPLADMLIPARFRERHRQGMLRYLDTGEGPFLGKRVEVTAQRADGTEFPGELAIAVAKEPGGQFFVGYLRDITERKRAETERAQLEAQLRQAQKMEAIGQLTGGIAHDFNNILQGVLGNLVMAEERQEALGDPKLGRYLERAHAASQRARDLIQQMLTFSRGRSGERRPAAAAELLEGATRLLRPTLPATIEVRTEVPDGVPGALLDVVQFEQVLLNLCINARDAMQGAGRLALSARLAAHEGAYCASCRQRFDGRFLEFVVHDSGPGIAPEVRERMFDPFFSTKEVGKGSGMGLAMVHGIVHQHGGHVLVDSAPGSGTTFRVLIPPAEAPAQAAADRPGAPGRRPRELLSGRVLVADDEESIRELLGDLLGDWGLDVVVCPDGSEARDAFADDPQGFDLVLTDQTMPRMTGLQLARLVTRMRPGMPVILCTGYGEDLTPAELETAGVRTLAKKPVEPAELRQLLQAALQTRNKAPT